MVYVPWYYLFPYKRVNKNYRRFGFASLAVFQHRWKVALTYGKRRMFSDYSTPKSDLPAIFRLLCEFVVMGQKTIIFNSKEGFTLHCLCFLLHEKIHWEAGKKARWLKLSIALAEDLSLFPSVYTRELTTACNLGAPTCLASAGTCAHVHTSIGTHIIKNHKINLFLFFRDSLINSQTVLKEQSHVTLTEDTSQCI